MKKIFFAVFACAAFLSAQWAAAVEVVYSYNVFYNPEVGSYIEIYISVPAKSLNVAAQTDGSQKAAANIALWVEQGEQIKAYDKYILYSPNFAEADKSQINLVDIKRYTLPAGAYTLHLQVGDENGTAADSRTFKSDLIVEAHPANAVAVSDILFLEVYQKETPESKKSFVRNGIEMVPYVFPYYPDSFTKLSFYAEIYNSHQAANAQDYVVTYQVVRKDSSLAINNIGGSKRHKAAPVNALLSEVNVADLSSGNYELLLEVRNAQNEVLCSRRAAFYRNHKHESVSLEQLNELNTAHTFVSSLSDEQVTFYVRSLRPIARPDERDIIINLKKNGDIQYQRNFLYNFWTQRDAYNPETAFLRYKKEVDYVESKYAGPIYNGFETDRGRVYLQYGAPNSVDFADFERDIKPYEIWQYYQIKSQTNVIFVFSDDDLMRNDMRLVHSDANGEVRDPEWKSRMLKYNRNNSGAIDP